MRRIALVFLAPAAFALLGASGAAAGPVNGAAIAPLAQQTNGVIQVRDRCGRNAHKDASGRCVRGCGEGWYFSPRRRHCVIAGEKAPPGGTGN